MLSLKTNTAWISAQWRKWRHSASTAAKEGIAGITPLSALKQSCSSNHSNKISSRRIILYLGKKKFKFNLIMNCNIFRDGYTEKLTWAALLGVLQGPVLAKKSFLSRWRDKEFEAEYKSTYIVMKEYLVQLSYFSHFHIYCKTSSMKETLYRFTFWKKLLITF